LFMNNDMVNVLRSLPEASPRLPVALGRN